MKLYTFYTDSHQSMYEEVFLPSLIPNEYELIAKKFDQHCPSGDFDSEGWDITMRNKAELILQAIEDNWGEVFVYVDCDVQFFQPTKDYIIESMGNADLICQNDMHSYCAGFVAVRANEKTQELYKKVIADTPKCGDDQRALNGVLRRERRIVKVKKFDNRIFTIAMAERAIWHGKEVTVPNNLLAHHANWTVGIENKLKLMEMVRKQQSL